MQNIDFNLIQKITPKSNFINHCQLQPQTHALAICELAQKHAGLLCVVANSSSHANQLQDELLFFGMHNVYQLPAWETLAYDLISPHKDIISSRLECLKQLPETQSGILILTAEVFTQVLPSVNFIQQHFFCLAKQENIEIKKFKSTLIATGYQHVSQVYEHGEFVVRGGLIDIFPMGSRYPFRIELFDNEVDSIRIFDVVTQKSIKEIDSISILPAKEFPTDKQAVTLFRENWHRIMPAASHICTMYENVSQGIFPAGVEYYMPLFFEATTSIFDYLPSTTLLTTFAGFNDSLNKHRLNLRDRFNSISSMRPILPVEHLHLSPEQAGSKIKQYIRVNITDIANSLPELVINSKGVKLAKLADFIASYPDTRILFCAESQGRQEVLLKLLQEINLAPVLSKSWEDFLVQKDKFCLTTYNLKQGLHLQAYKIALISEADLVGAVTYQRRNLDRNKANNLFIKNIAEINIGEPIVHIEKGIGRYHGLTKLSVNDSVGEYILIKYAAQDKLYVPVSDLSMLSRYAGIDPDNAPLHSLGKKTWSKEKTKAIAQVADVAAQLLAANAKRAMAKGFAFEIPDNYPEFASSFPFVTTPDQQDAIDAILDDLSSTKITDRLICGDVGFGKTEVAMRAAFVAASNSKQTLVLVPTTLLAQQHYKNFADRFSNYPISVEVLSRFISEKQQKLTLQEWQSGRLDILVGTHRLLSKDLKSKSLGLLIVDEEHRFGVAQKDKIKQQYSHIDSIFMTATPIPRTLNMSLCKLRDLSIMATPPVKRLAVQTFIHEYNTSLVIEAITREIGRGGQVYFLHNQVSSIDKMYLDLSKLLPEVNMVVAHGQMPERQLELIMRDFYHQKYQVLIATTIIESGIDIPSANTIIINKADMFGLAQLHQIRGRVGRSHHQAYAYLLTPPAEALTDDAKQRFAAISSSSHLGAGFNLASQDLEIRGAGELLGDKQSGQMQQIGFSLYMQLLEKTIDDLQAGKEVNYQIGTEFDKVEVNLCCSSLIPENYILDTHIRLQFYSAIGNAINQDALDNVMTDMIDRFGLLPPAVKNLFAGSSIALTAKKIGINSISADDKIIGISMSANSQLNPATIISLIQSAPSKYKLLKDGFTFSASMLDINSRVETVKNLLARLATS